MAGFRDDGGEEDDGRGSPAQDQYDRVQGQVSTEAVLHSQMEVHVHGASLVGDLSEGTQYVGGTKCYGNEQRSVKEYEVEYEDGFESGYFVRSLLD